MKACVFLKWGSQMSGGSWKVENKQFCHQKKTLLETCFGESVPPEHPAVGREQVPVGWELCSCRTRSLREQLGVGVCLP